MFRVFELAYRRELKTSFHIKSPLKSAKKPEKKFLVALSL